MKHRIIKNVKYDSYSNIEDEYYYVQREKSFLGIKRWSYYKTDVLGSSGLLTSTPIVFKSYKDAYDFCQRVNNVASPNELKKEVYTKNK